MVMKTIWNWAQAGFLLLGSGLGWYFGDVDGVFYTLIAFVVADYITGVLVAIVQHTLSSGIGSKGIAKKVAIFILIGIGHLIDHYILHTGSALRTALLFFYIANEGLSILENSISLGLPVPAKLRDVLKQLETNSDGGDNL